jgi:outer membrane protein
MKHLRIILCLIPFLITGSYVSGQSKISEFTADSVDLQKLVNSVIETHPSVLKAQEAINTGEANIGLSKASYYPNIELGAGYTRIGPVPNITIPNLGHFEMAPANNYNTTLDIHQMVYDFSKTKTNILVAESNKAIAAKNIDLVKQRLTILTITSYYSLAYLQEAIHIKEKQLGILEQHLDFVTRKKETGSATDFEILSTKVRISAAKNQKLDLETALNNQLAVINSLLGLPENTRIKVKNRLSAQVPTVQYDSLINYALDHRSEILLAGLREKQAELHLQSLKLENNPVISAFASGGIKNGYFPDMNQPKANYTAGLGIKVPIYTATRHKNLLLIAASDISSIKQDIEQNRRDISSEVYQNTSNLEASIRKIRQSELQLEQSEEALNLADLSYKAGTLTNMDLLDSESLEADSQLNLMKAKIEYMINSVKLDISIGKPGY